MLVLNFIVNTYIFIFLDAFYHETEPAKYSEFIKSLALLEFTDDLS